MGQSLGSYARRRFALVSALAVLLSLVPVGVFAPVAAADPIGLSGWTAEKYAGANVQDTWVASGDGFSVTQDDSVPESQGQFTPPVGTLPALGRHTITITPGPDSQNDDDIFGFMLGYTRGDFANPAADYLLVDWKRITQAYPFDLDDCFNLPENPDGNSTALAGLAISQVTGIPTIDELWGHTEVEDCENAEGTVTELARASNLGATGWTGPNPPDTYVFDVLVESHRVQIWVDGVLEIDVPVSASSVAGDLALYNFSQGGVTYSIESEPLSFDGFDVQLNGSAVVVPDGSTGEALRLTTTGAGQVGTALWTSPLVFPGPADWSSAFEFRITDPNPWGGQPTNQDGEQDASGDGLTFIVAGSPTAIGAGGSDIGVPGAPSLAVEFDTFDNTTSAGFVPQPPSQEPSGNHIGINANGNPASVEFFNGTAADFDNGNVWSAWVDYIGSTGTVEVYVAEGADSAKPSAPVLTSAVPESVITEFDAIENTGYVGFSSGSGAANASHEILSWEFTQAAEAFVSFSATSVGSEGSSNIVRAPGYVSFDQLDPLAGLREGASDPVDTGAAISSIGAAISSIGAPISSIGAAISSIGSPISSIGAAISSIGAPISSIDIASTGAAISSIGSPISSIGAAISSIGAPISSIPITKDGVTWEDLLAGTIYEGIPLQTISFGDVLENEPEVIENFTFADFDFSGTEIASLSVASLTIGNLTLNEIGVTCADVGLTTGCSESTTTIVDADLAGGDIQAVGAAISSIPVNTFDLDDQPIGSITIGSIGAAISSIYLDLAFDCTSADCTAGSTMTLAEAQNLDAISVELTMAELYLLILPVESYDWTDVDLDSIDPDSGPLINYVVEFNQTTNTSADATIQVALPEGIRYLEGSSRLDFDDVADPVVGTSGDLVWTLPTGTVGTYRLSFRGRVGFVDLGTYVADASVDVDGTVLSVSAAAPVIVRENFEPNGFDSAQPINSSGLYVSYITEPTDEDFYSFTVPEGTKTTVILSHLDEDFDLIYFEPAGEEPSDRTESDFGPSTPPVDDEGRHLSDVPLDSEAADDVGIDSTGAAISSIGSPISSIGSPISSISTNRGTADEEVSGSTAGPGGFDATIRVASYNGETSTAPYVAQLLQQEIVPVSCATTATLNGGQITTSLPTLDPATNTLILWNPERMESLETGSAATIQMQLDDLVDSLTGAAAPDLSALGIVPAVIPVDGDPNVRAAFGTWDDDPCSVEAANDVVAAINSLVDLLISGLADGQITSITLIGPDAVMPHERRPDTTLISNESEFAPALVNQNGDQSGLYGALAAGFVPSDDAYGAFTSIFPWIDHNLYLPDAAVGRVTGDGAEVAAQIGQYITAGGILNPGSAAADLTAFNSGYDFLEDGANAQADALDEIIAAQPGDVGTERLISDTWTSIDLANGAFAADSTDPADIIGLGAHFDFDELVPADIGVDLTDVDPTNDNYATSDLTALAPDLLGRVIFSVGCHAALNIPDGLTLPGTQSTEDWADVFSTAGAVFVGNLGYGYGLDGDVGLSEQLMTDFVGNLDGSLTIGDALAVAKRDYFSRKLVYGSYDEKILAEATLYGFPFWRLSGDPVTGPTLPPSPPAGTVTVSPTHDIQSAGDNGSFYKTQDESTSLHNRPIQPKQTFSYSTDGSRATGVMIRELSSTDEVGFDVAFARPIVDDANREQEIETEGAIFPNVFASTNSYQTAGGTVSNVVLATGQYIGEQGGIQRLFTSIEFEPLFGMDGGIAPQIQRADALLGAGTLRFEVQVTTSDGQPADEVLVLYKAAGTNQTPTAWTPLSLTETSPGLWTATVPGWSGEQVEWLGQVRHGTLVGSSYNKGQLFSARLLDAGEDATINVGELFEPDARFVDAPTTGAPSDYSAIVDWGDGTSEIGAVVDDPISTANRISASHAYAEAGIYTVEVCVSGLSTGQECDSLTLTVEGDTLPGIFFGPITGAPDGPVPIGTTVTLSSEVVGGPAPIIWDWGDGAKELDPDGIIEGVVSESHFYNTPGVHAVEVSSAGGRTSARYEYIVVYDPEGGFVTGGGWIQSPAGAYAPAPTLEGRANFGFVSKYKKGQSTPSGDTTFQFRAADLKFESTSYDWLVIAGRRAQFKGSGLINDGLAPNGEEFKFFLVGFDGDWNDQDDPDRFRIKIWYEDAGSEIVVYDNKPGSGTDSDDSTELGGGSIVVHDGGKGGGKK